MQTTSATATTTSSTTEMQTTSETTTTTNSTTSTTPATALRLFYQNVEIGRHATTINVHSGCPSQNDNKKN